MILNDNDPKYRQCSLSVMDNIADPHISFDQNGCCNACLWSFKKKKIDWKKRIYTLKKLLNTYKSEVDFNCLVPV